MEYAEEAIVVSNKAVDCDCNGQLQAAVYYYKEAATLLELAWKIRKHDPLADEWCKKSHDYINRAEALEYQSNFLLITCYFFIYVIHKCMGRTKFSTFIVFFIFFHCSTYLTT